MTGVELARALARELGVPEPDDSEVNELLALAGTAAHATERLAAPLCTYLAGRSGRDPAEIHQLVRRLAVERPATS